MTCWHRPDDAKREHNNSYRWEALFIAKLYPLQETCTICNCLTVCFCILKHLSCFLWFYSNKLCPFGFTLSPCRVTMLVKHFPNAYSTLTEPEYPSQCTEVGWPWKEAWISIRSRVFLVFDCFHTSPPSLLSSTYPKFFPQGIKLTTRFHLILRWGMHGTIHLVSHVFVVR